MGTIFSQNTDRSIGEGFWDNVVGDPVDIWPGEEHPSFVFSDNIPDLFQQQLFFMGIASDAPFYLSSNGMGAVPQSHTFRMFATKSLLHINPGHCRFVQTSTMNWQLRFRYSTKQDCQMTIYCYAKLNQDHKTIRQSFYSIFYLSASHRADCCRIERALQTSKSILLSAGRNQLFSSSANDFISQPQHLPSLCHFGKEANPAVYDLCIIITPHIGTQTSTASAASAENSEKDTSPPSRRFFGLDGKLVAFRRGGNDSPVSPPPSSSRSLYYTAITGTNYSSDNSYPGSKDTCISKQIYCFRVSSSSAARYGRYLDAIADDSFRPNAWNGSHETQGEAKSSSQLAAIVAHEAVLGTNNDSDGKASSRKRIGPRATAAALKIGNLNLDLARHKVETNSGVFTLQPVFGQDGDEKSSPTKDDLDAKQSDDEHDTNSNVESIEDGKVDEHKSTKDGSGQSLEMIPLSTRETAASLPSLPPPPSEEIIDFSTDTSNDNTCVICLTNPRDAVLFPCRHMYTCFECSQMLHVNRNKCPVCRKVAKALIHLKS